MTFWVAAAVVVARTSRSKAGLSARYDSPAVRRERAEQDVRSAAVDADEEPSERAEGAPLVAGEERLYPVRRICTPLRDEARRRPQREPGRWVIGGE